MNRVRKISDRGRPVVSSSIRRMSGALINHCMYRTHYVHKRLKNKAMRIGGVETYEDATRCPYPKLCSNGRLSQVGCHGEIRYRRHHEDDYGEIMKRSCSAILLSIEIPVKTCQLKSQQNRPTSFDHANTIIAEMIITVNTTQHQSDPPTVRWRAAKDGLR